MVATSIQILAIAIILILIISSLLPRGERNTSREEKNEKEFRKEPEVKPAEEPEIKIEKKEEIIQPAKKTEEKIEETIVVPAPLSSADSVPPVEIKKTAVEEVKIITPNTITPPEETSSLKNEEEEHKKVIMAFLEGKTEERLTHEEIERFLNVPDDTVTRYLEELEKEGKITKASAGSDPILKRTRGIFSLFKRSKE